MSTYHNNVDEQLTPEEKLFWLSYIEAKLGLVLPNIQQRRFETRIIERMRAYNLDSDEYFQRVKEDDGEWQTLIDELIIPETSFFRHQPSFELVKQHLTSKQGRCHLWSVGCSTGEEAWSLAITASGILDAFKVMATDVSETSIRHAKSAVYAQRKLAKLDERTLSKYFEPIDSGSNSALTPSSYRIQDGLRDKVSFYRHNLIDDKRLPFREIDIVFCQNVLIYFRSFVQRDILNQLVKSLSVGGLLVLAPGEARSWQHPEMQQVKFDGTLAFQRMKK